MEEIFRSIIEAILFFLPAYLANMAPVVAGNIKFLRIAKVPIDSGLKLNERYLFGKNKTWLGLVTAGIGGVIGAVLLKIVFGNFVSEYYGLGIIQIYKELSWISVMGLGLIVGECAILGDLIESFLKRRFNFRSGESLPILDQIDFIVGAYIGYLIVGINVSLKTLIIVLLVTPIFHLIVNIIAYKMKLKDVWW